MLTSALSPTIRRAAYLVFAFVTVAAGAAQTGYQALGRPNPDWLTVALQVIAYLGAALGITAAAHTPTRATAASGEGGPVAVIDTDTAYPDWADGLPDADHTPAHADTAQEPR